VRERERLTCRLGEEGENIQPDKDLGELDALDAPDLLLGNEEVYHAAEDHIVERINPHGRQQEEDLGDGSEGSGLLVPCAGDAECKTGQLPGSAHDDDPAETDPLVEEGLEDVDEGGDAEGDGKDEGTSEGGIIVVVGVARPLGDVAILPWGDTHAGSSRRGRRGRGGCRGDGGRHGDGQMKARGGWGSYNPRQEW
jgi:hypothetical protein